MAIDLSQTVEQILNGLDARMTAAEASTPPAPNNALTFAGDPLTFAGDPLTYGASA